MNTFLLLLNLAMNIFIIINIANIKSSMIKPVDDKKFKNAINKYYTRIKNKIDENDLFDELEDDFEDSKIKVIEGNVSPRVEKLRKKWEEEDMKEKYSQISKYVTFKNVYEFIDYLSTYNLKIVDTIYGKVRTVMYLDNYTYKNQETVLITFDDNTKAIFKPNIYARIAYSIN